MRDSAAGVALLRVTVTSSGGIAELKVEGSLACPAVTELWRECQHQMAAGSRLRLDLSGVTQIDRASVERLKRLVRNGVQIVSAPLLLTALIDEDA